MALTPAPAQGDSDRPQRGRVPGLFLSLPAGWAGRCVSDRGWVSGGHLALALGMGIFFTVYHVVMTAVPPRAGRHFDTTGNPYAAIVLAAALFAVMAPGFLGFGVLRKKARWLGPTRNQSRHQAQR